MNSLFTDSHPFWTRGTINELEPQRAFRALALLPSRRPLVGGPAQRRPRALWLLLCNTVPVACFFV